MSFSNSFLTFVQQIDSLWRLLLLLLIEDLTLDGWLTVSHRLLAHHLLLPHHLLLSQHLLLPLHRLLLLHHLLLAHHVLLLLLLHHLLSLHLRWGNLRVPHYLRLRTHLHISHLLPLHRLLLRQSILHHLLLHLLLPQHGLVRRHCLGGHDLTHHWSGDHRRTHPIHLVLLVAHSLVHVLLPHQHLLLVHHLLLPDHLLPHEGLLVHLPLPHHVGLGWVVRGDVLHSLDVGPLYVVLHRGPVIHRINELFLLAKHLGLGSAVFSLLFKVLDLNVE